MTKKVKLPTFSGTDPRGWLTKAETYFLVLDVLDHLRVPLAHICMEGVVVHWFSILRESHNPLSWADFQKELLNRFGGVINMSPYEQLAALHQ